MASGAETAAAPRGEGSRGKSRVMPLREALDDMSDKTSERARDVLSRVLAHYVEHEERRGTTEEDAGNCNASDPPTEVVREGAAADATHRVARGAERETESTEARRLRSEILAMQCISRGVVLPRSMLAGTIDVAEAVSRAAWRPPAASRADAARTARVEAERKAMAAAAKRQMELEDLSMETVPHEDRVRVAISKKLLNLAGLQRELRLSVRAERDLSSMTASTLIDWRRFRVGVSESEFSHTVLDANRVLSQKGLRENRPAQALSPTAVATTSRQGSYGGQNKLRPKVESAADVAARKARQEANRKRQAEAQRQFQAEMQRRLKKEQERKQQKKFLASVFDMQKTFANPQRVRRREMRVKNNFVLGWHEKSERKLRRDQEQRLRALKSSDHESYARLVQESKNERLQMLLGKTNDIMGQLGQRLKKKQQLDAEAADADGGDGAGGGVDDADDAEGGTAAVDLMSGTKNFNKTVLSVEAEVLEQPALLRGVSLRNYQLAGLRWMASLYSNNMNGILADEMGLGKTVQTISLIAYLMETKGCYGPHLILAPKATLSNWYAEMRRWCPEIDVIYYDGKPDDRKAMREGPIRDGTFNVLLTHYDLVINDKAALRKVLWNYLIIDEGHRMKNHKSKLAELLQREYTFKFRLLLTGTPIQNNLMELWALLNFILPHIFNSADSFDDWFNAPFAGDKEDIELNDEEQQLIILRLHSVLRPFLLRRTKKEVELDLPEKQSGIIKCGLSAWQKMYYTSVIENKRVGSTSLNNRAMQLRKVCNHPYLFLKSDIVGWTDERDARLLEITRASGKLALLASVLKKLKRTGHRVLLFSQQTRALDVIQEYLELVGYKHLRLDGSVGGDQRREMLEQFNAQGSELFVFLLSTRAGGLGLNLQTADTVIIYDSDWNPQADAQAEDRAHRIGQKHEVRVLVLVSAGTIEERILERANHKRQIDEQVIQAGMFNSNWSEEDRSKILTEALKKTNLSDLGGGVTSNPDVNRMIARSDEEMEIFEAMDLEDFPDDPSSIRLMTEKEIPAYVLEEEKRTQEEANARALENDPTRWIENAGDDGGARAGRRAKQRTVIYADMFSDEQFTKLVEEGADLQQEAKRLYNKQQRRQNKRAEKARDAAAAAAAVVTAGDCDQDAGGQEPVAASNGVASSSKQLGKRKRTALKQKTKDVRMPEPNVDGASRPENRSIATGAAACDDQSAGGEGPDPADGVASSSATIGKRRRKVPKRVEEGLYAAGLKVLSRHQGEGNGNATVGDGADAGGGGPRKKMRVVFKRSEQVPRAREPSPASSAEL